MVTGRTTTARVRVSTSAALAVVVATATAVTSGWGSTARSAKSIVTISAIVAQANSAASSLSRCVLFWSQSG